MAVEIRGQQLDSAAMAGIPLPRNGPLSVRSTATAATGAELFSAALFLAYIAVVLCHSSPPSLADFGDLVYQARVLHTHMIGQVDPFHSVKHYPVPNGLATVGLCLLMLAFSWATAAKLWLCFQFALSWAVVRYFLRSVEHARVMAWIAPTAIFLNLNFWYGFLNFELGLCWAILLAAVLCRGARDEWPVGVLLTLGFLSHLVPFASMSVMLIAYVWQTRRARLLWQMAPPAILGLWYLYGRYYVSLDPEGQVGVMGPIPTFSGAFWLFKLNCYLKSFGWVNPGTRVGSYAVQTFGESAYALLFVANLVLALVLGYCLVRSAWAALQQHRPDRFIWIAAVCLLPVYLLLPSNALGISDPGSRILQSFLCVCLLLCAPSRALGVAAASSALLAAASLVLFGTVGYALPPAQTPARVLPALLVRFAHVPNHGKDYYLDALREGDDSLAVFPTGLLLNTPSAVDRPYEEQ